MPRRSVIIFQVAIQPTSKPNQLVQVNFWDDSAKPGHLSLAALISHQNLAIASMRRGYYSNDPSFYTVFHIWVCLRSRTFDLIDVYHAFVVVHCGMQCLLASKVNPMTSRERSTGWSVPLSLRLFLGRVAKHRVDDEVLDMTFMVS